MLMCESMSPIYSSVAEYTAQDLGPVPIHLRVMVNLSIYPLHMMANPSMHPPHMTARMEMDSHAGGSPIPI